MRMRHRVLMDHCQDRLDHCRNQSMQSSLLPSRSLLNMLCMVWTRLGLRPASPGDTQYILLHQLYSHDRLGTAYSQLTGQSPGRLGLPRSWDIPSSLGLSETLRDTHYPRHRTVSLDPDRCHDIQMGSVCKRLPQRARSNPHRTANTVWKGPCRYLRNPQRTGGRIPVQMSYRCHWYRLRTLCWETSQYPLFRLRIQCMWWRLAARRCHFHKQCKVLPDHCLNRLHLIHMWSSLRHPYRHKCPVRMMHMELLDFCLGLQFQERMLRSPRLHRHLAPLCMCRRHTQCSPIG